MPSPSSLTATILIVEDDPEQLRLYARALRGFRLVCTGSARAALGALESCRPDVIILDQVLEAGERGENFLPEFKRRAAHVPVIMVSGTMHLRDQVRALQGPQGAHFVLAKPVDLDELERTIAIALTECGFKEAILLLQSLERADPSASAELTSRFTERLARQHDLLRRLRGQSAKPNISQLARDYAVSRKTILRDLHDLIQRGQLDSTGYPEIELHETEPNGSAQ